MYLLSILFEIQFNNSSSKKITLLNYIPSSFILTRLFFLLSMMLLLIRYKFGQLIIYMIVLKYFQSIPVLTDLIHILFIYQQNSSLRIKLCLMLNLIRLIISSDMIRQKLNSKSKRKIMIIFDLAFFILINMTLIRNSDYNLIHIGRKLILGLLIFYLNHLFSNEKFWNNLFRQVNHRINYSNLHSKLIYLILFIRWFIFILLAILSLFIHINLVLLLIYMGILYGMYHDILYNQKILKQYGFIYFCIGFDITKTCLVCFDERNLCEFELLIRTDCRHLQRSVCNICVIKHVQQTFQIAFTDDIYCPELECGVRFNYQTVKALLLLHHDQNLRERYDRYAVHRKLEQMNVFIWCLYLLCNPQQLNISGKLNNIVIWFNCHIKTCFKHIIRCYDVDQNDESTRRWIIEHSKKCPKCPYHIEKNDGCDHMKCIKCKHEFCWSCLADFQPIRRDGNHRHKSTCKHYAAYDVE